MDSLLFDYHNIINVNIHELVVRYGSGAKTSTGVEANLKSGWHFTTQA